VCPRANTVVQSIRKMSAPAVERLKAYLREHLPTAPKRAQFVSDRGAEDAYAIASAFARSSAAGGVLATRSSNIDRKACIHRW